MKWEYKKESILDFGLYKGYELGIVYVFDPMYIDWCINNIENFYIADIEELMDYVLINENLNWQYRANGDSSIIPGIDDFKTYKELIENKDIGNKKNQFSNRTLLKNKINSSKRYLNINPFSNYEDILKYEEQNGYCGNDGYNNNDEYDI
jgi:hypothetical protein